MTRFATFWVEGGEIAQPIEVMRFDDSLYDLFGDRLEALSAERETVLSNDTYGERKAESRLVPGALLKELRFTL
jgi:predicted Zn-dependent protease